MQSTEYVIASVIDPIRDGRVVTRPIDLPIPPDEGDWALEVEVTAGDD